EGFYGTTQYFLQSAIQFIARQRSAHLQSNLLTFFFEERQSRFKSQCCCKLRIVANLWMEIERQMRAVKRDVVFKGDLQLPPQQPSCRFHTRQKKTASND